MRIKFLDATCPRPYDNAVLQATGLGGTEATVIRVATALSRRHRVTVHQHNRQEATVESPTLRFEPMATVRDDLREADHVVFVTKAQGLGDLAPDVRGRLWLWLHNYLVDEIPFHWTDHLRHRLGIVCVSRTHARHTRSRVARHLADRVTFGRLGRAGIVHHYNPIDPSLVPRANVARDPHKLVFFSSPHKGLEQVLARFGEAHALRPELRLFVADPGYSKAPALEGLGRPGIVRLGTLSQDALAQHVREACCVFYPQSKRAETFGLVYAESNAVGTPVLAHDFGSAREILSAANPPLDARSSNEVLARLSAWVDGDRPVVAPDSRFSIAAVTESWQRFLDDPDGFARQQRRDDDVPPVR